MGSEPHHDTTIIEIAVDRIPLDNLLRAISRLRGESNNTPPDAGTAGLKI